MTTSQKTCTIPSQGPPDASIDAVAVLQSLSSGVVVVDDSLKVRYANPAVTHWLGEADTLDALFRSSRFLGPWPGWREEFETVLSTGAPRQAECVTTPAGDETPTVLGLTCTPLVAPGQTGAVGMVITVQDVSLRASLEERLAVAQRMASVGKLAARVAHELNNPLDGILRYINLSIRLTDRIDEPKLRSYLDESRDGLMRMIQIIGELLKYSRTTRGRSEVVNVGDLVKRAIREMSPRARNNSVAVSANFKDQDLPVVRGDRLHQVCCNLIGNAIDAMPDGGRLTVTIELIDDQIVIRMADTGHGLPQPIEQIYEPFFTTKEPGRGTGLGLAICKDFVTDMGGTIEGANAANGGAVFTVRLPAGSGDSATERCPAIEPTAGMSERAESPPSPDGRDDR